MGPLRTGQPEHIVATGAALGLLELQSIARGLTVADALVKARRGAASPKPSGVAGRSTWCCAAAMSLPSKKRWKPGVRKSRAALCDELLLTQVHDEVVDVLRRKTRPPWRRLVVGILETPERGIDAAWGDATCKAAEVRLHDLRLCDGLGGKGFAILVGEQDMVQAALATVEQLLPLDFCFQSRLIARPHPDFLQNAVACCPADE